MTDDDRTVSEAAALISKKWHPVILQSLLEDGPLRFSELRDRHGVSAKVLTESLEDLVENDLVRRVEVSQSPLRVEYELTSHGRDLRPVIDALAEWGDRHLGEDVRPTVLVVDDDPRLAAMHADWLATDYQVRRAHDGAAALAGLDESVDAVVLDRRMPGLSGDEVLERLRERDLDCRVVMVSVVEPDLDVVGMAFDAYLVKPTSGPELRETVAEVLERERDGAVEEYLTLREKRELLLDRWPERVLERSEPYRRLTTRIDELETELDGPEESSTLQAASHE